MKYKLKFKKQEETEAYIIFVLDMKGIKLDSGTFYNLKNGMIGNLVRGLHEEGIELNDLLKENLGEFKCKVCGKPIDYKYHRKRVRVKKYCNLKTGCWLLSDIVKNQRKERRMQKCKYCGDWFERKMPLYNIRYKEKGVCTKSECKLKYRKETDQKIRNNHWANKDKNKAKEIFSKIVKTRLNNNKKYNRKYIPWNKGLKGVQVPWNKGKTGIYSEETLEKLRKAAIKKFNDKCFKKTGIEKKIEEFLNELNIKYKYSFIFRKRQFDFMLPEYNIIIETNGDFWHGNPKLYGKNKKKGNLKEWQKEKQIDDIIKCNIANDGGYEIFSFWEDDIYNKTQRVIDILKQIKGGEIIDAKRNAEKLFKNN